MIVPDVNGYLFPAGDTGALAARLTQLADRDRRSLLGRNARERVERLYSDKIMADRYEQTLLSIMEAAAPKGLWTANTR
jgi:glycosyltransferase involved in cell wall biosynthesis